MDFRQVILESLIEKLLSQRVDELSGDTLRSYIFKAERSGPHQKGSKRAVGIAKAKYRSERLKSERNRHDIEPKEFEGHSLSSSLKRRKSRKKSRKKKSQKQKNQFGRSGSDLEAPLPLNGNKRGDSVNTSRGPTSTEKAEQEARKAEQEARKAERLETVKAVFAARKKKKKS